MDKSEKIKAFVSLTNFGMVVEDAPSSNYFSDQAVLFIKSLSAKNDFSDREIVRIGTRSFFIAGRKESFEDLKKKYLENFLELKPNAIKIFGSNPVDVGAPFNFIVNKSEAFNTMSGPMEREQMKKFLKPIKIYNDDKLPKQGLYFEIDYFTQNVGRIKEEELESIVRSNIEKSAGIFERFKKTILDLEN
ncbi:MAG: hypothetical protein Q8Q48_02335 [Candidatus Staskawiczbacteria bacterium]|nr:hypothetical protein [Candidatus Staskawiczbacteria bacterium]